MGVGLMGKPVRIYQLARELNVESKEILRVLHEKMNIDINNHMSAINDQVAAKVRYLLKGQEPVKQRPAPAQSEPAPAAGSEPKPERREPSGERPVQAPAAAPSAPGPAWGRHGIFPARPPQGDRAGGGRPGPGYGGGPRGDRAGGGRPGPGYGGGPRGDRAGGGRPGPGYGGGPRGDRPMGGRPGPGYGGGPRGDRPMGGRPGPGYGGGPRGDRLGVPRPGGLRGDRFGPGRPGLPRGGPGGPGRPGMRPAAPVATLPRPAKPAEKPWEIRKREGDQDETFLNKLRRGGEQRGEVRPAVAQITLSGPLTVGELAEQLKLKASDVITKLMSLGVLATINQQLDLETAMVVAEELGTRVEIREPAEEPSDEELLARVKEEERAEPERLRPRAPVVTVLGHVDHGKTTLLDAIRETRVVATEAGGITQHIGASVVKRNGKRIVFLDTPGHEAFAAMRARGAKVTDVAVLVVAADDGVMPQTVEALNHAREAGVPIVVAVNKIDKPGANPERVKQQLAEHGLIPEEWGGDTIYVPISALKKTGIDNLLDMIQLVAEVQELKANPERPAVGTVIEARLDKGRGPVATVLVQHGTLRLGDAFVAGLAFGKVRAMMDDRGNPLKEAGPATPVEVLGFDDVPQAGDVFRVVADEKTARGIAEVRRARQREKEMAAPKVVSLSDFYEKVKEGELKELKVVLKADVQGSLEALRGALEKLQNEEARVSVIHGGVGGISESDVMLAAAAKAIIIGFNVRPDARTREVAEQQRVEIRTYRVIYEAIQEVEQALKGLLSPRFEEVVLGRAEVRQTFRVSGVGTVAGLYVTEGKVQRNARARVIRDGTVVHEGEIASLRRFKEDVREVAAGTECGLALARFQDVKVGDVIEVFVEQEVER